ncbi:MAG: hypothetical protein Q9168_007533 [Polycauliona sp. 1 TL-2023]
MSFLLSLLSSKLNPPSQPTHPFTSRTILVTGANSGLGLQSAQKFISLGAKTVILACRTIKKAEGARNEIVEATGCEGGRMRCMELDMGDFGSIRGFVAELRKMEGGLQLDVALLNAGVVQFGYEVGSGGWEQTLGVNVLGTTLLAMLLLPILRSQPSTPASPSTIQNKNLVFVSSGNYQYAALSPTALTSSSSLLQYYNQRQNFAGPEEQYSISKLFLMYAADELAAASTMSIEHEEKKKEGDVVINSVNPGATATNLTRNISGFFLSIVAYVYLTLLARTAEQGSRSLVAACSLGRESSGGLWQDDALVSRAPIVSSDEGQKLQKRVWREIVAELKDVDDVAAQYVE